MGIISFVIKSNLPIHVIWKCPVSIAILQNSLKKLGFQNIALRSEDGLEFAKQINRPFDVILLDPPFQSDYLSKLLPVLVDKLAADGLIYVESGAPFEPDQEWQVVKQAKAGAVFYQLLLTYSLEFNSENY